RVLGEDHMNTLLSMRDLAELLEQTDRPAETEHLWRQMIDIRLKSVPENHWWVANPQSRLGGSLLMQGKFAEAEPLLLQGFEALAAARNTPRKPRDFLREACERVIKLYEQWHKAEPGKGHDVKASEWKAKLRALSTG